MKKLDQVTLHSAISLLAELIEDQPPLHFVVCGESSLLALGLVSRTTTRDVDVLALIQDGSLQTAKPLPAYLQQAIVDVGKELGLMDQWFNTGPSDESFFRFGLPEGLADRLTARNYGKALTISYISRTDQMHFKLYAAADNGPGASRHSEDLKDLAPTSDELLAAARWTLRHDDSEGFRMLLSETLNQLGHHELIAGL
jgi:hypothetical protein